MTTEESLDLHSGDEVYWNDPDEGKCSRLVKILEITVIPDDGSVSIIDMNGEHLECYDSELS